jgi:hypothetical protein
VALLPQLGTLGEEAADLKYAAVICDLWDTLVPYPPEVAAKAIASLARILSMDPDRLSEALLVGYPLMVGDAKPAHATASRLVMTDRTRSLLVLLLVAPIGCGPASSPVPATPTAAATYGDQAWVAVAPLRSPRSHLGAVSVGGAIFAIGGLAQGTTVGSVTVERYERAANSWSAVADLPQGTDHAMVAAMASRIFVFGGGFSSPSRRSYRFDVEQARWVEIAPLPEMRAAGGAAVIGSRIYVAGGFGANRQLLATAYAYDPDSDRFERIPDLPIPREHVAVVAFRGRLCVLGGHFGAADQSTLAECFDPTTRRWSELPPMPRRASDFDAVVVSDLIWTVGDGVQVFDGQRWWVAPPLSTPRFGVAAAAIDRSIYVIGGAPRRPALLGIVERIDVP